MSGKNTHTRSCHNIIDVATVIIHLENSDACRHGINSHSPCPTTLDASLLGYHKTIGNLERREGMGTMTIGTVLMDTTADNRHGGIEQRITRDLDKQAVNKGMTGLRSQNQHGQLGGERGPCLYVGLMVTATASLESIAHIHLHVAKTMVADSHGPCGNHGGRDNDLLRTNTEIVLLHSETVLRPHGRQGKKET